MTEYSEDGYTFNLNINMLETFAVTSNDLVILGVTFDSNMTLEKNLRSVTRAASQSARTRVTRTGTYGTGRAP